MQVASVIMVILFLEQAVEVGATLEAAALLLAVIQDAQGRVGFKAAGGVRTADEAAGYLHLATTILGPGWAQPGRFRFGKPGTNGKAAQPLALP